ncbi:MAG: hypothetical protein COB98_09265 [Flavobacteriaceae bacterium]|nr:MAG: hypothetical protein COB98_09265 [Flavobacteriaceae bacterium]
MNHKTFSSDSFSRPYFIAFCCVLLIVGGGLYLLREKELNDLREIGNDSFSEFVLKSKKKHLKTVITSIVKDLDIEYNFHKGTTDSITFYSENFQAIIRQEALHRIARFPIGKNNYIWVSEIKNYDGGDKYAIQLLNKNQPEINNKYMSTFEKDIKGNYLLSVELEGVKKHQSFFYSYWMPKLNSDSITQKISYVKLFKPYHWIIGTGAHLDVIKNQAKKNRLNFKEKINERTKYTLFYSFILLLISIAIAYFYNKKIKKTIHYYISKVTRKEAELISFNNALEEKITLRTHDVLKANKELKAAMIMAEENARVKDAFLANMSHEVRTPMNSIIGFSELLEEDDNSPQQIKKYSSFIQESSQQLLGIFNDLLDVSRLESNQLEVNCVKIASTDILKTLHEIHEKKFKNHAVSLILKQPDNAINIQFYGDYNRVVQVFNKLIHNAFKFTSEGSIAFGYSILKNTPSDMIVFYVTDTGIGILKENYHLLFHNFTQGGEGTYKQGNGIGLSIARGLVHLMKGKIWFVSDLGKGSTFYFSLPIANED